MGLNKQKANCTNAKDNGKRNSHRNNRPSVNSNFENHECQAGEKSESIEPLPPFGMLYRGWLFSSLPFYAHAVLLVER